MIQKHLVAVLAAFLCAPIQVRAEEAWRFFLIGDSRSYPEILEQNIRSMMALDSAAVVAFNAGDLTTNGFSWEWKRHMQAIADGSAGLVRSDVNDFGPWVRYIGAVGNHDTHNWLFWLQNWNEHLSGQKDLGSNGTGGVYFSLAYSNAIFFVLDSQHPSAEQTQWLRDELLSPAAQEAVWKIAIFHHPVYPCNGKKPFHEGLEWVQVFEENNFDLVHVAHSHTFERTCPMRDGRCAEGGVIYLNSSGAGAPSREILPDKSATVSFETRSDSYACSEILTASGAYWHFFCHAVVEDQQLDVACYSHDDINVVYDQFTIDKTPPDRCVDQDGDGYGSPASPDCFHPELDCDDNDAGANPGIPGSCGSTGCVDQDGDGYGSPTSPDCFHPELDCDDNDAGANPGIPGSCSSVGCVDRDADGYGDPASPDCRYQELDCNDDDPTVNPGAPGSCRSVGCSSTSEPPFVLWLVFALFLARALGQWLNDSCVSAESMLRQKLACEPWRSGAGATRQMR